MFLRHSTNPPSPPPITMTDQQIMSRYIADLRKAGYSFNQVADMFEKATRAAYAMTLLPEEIEALRRPVGRAAAEHVERIEARCLSENLHMTGQPNNKTVLSLDNLAPKAYRSPTTLYIDGCDKTSFFAEADGTVVFTNATQHNLGADLVYFDNYNREERTARVTLVQQKVGKTPLGNGTGKTNENRSADPICMKLYDAAKIVRERLETEYDVRAECRLQVHTTSAVRPSARARFEHHKVTLVDATDMWSSVWTQPVKDTIVHIHGPTAAKGLGVLL